MSRKNLASLCIVVAAIGTAVAVPLTAGDTAAPAPAQQSRGGGTLQPLGDGGATAALTPLPPARASDERAVRQRRAEARRAREQRARALRYRRARAAVRARRVAGARARRVAAARERRVAALRERAQRTAPADEPAFVTPPPAPRPPPASRPRPVTPPPPPPGSAFDDSG